ncbi:hypothetical protein HK099_008418 [Clydaea vesicula]|uniref:GAF domain-containing protein n=1 Tax=Clydaea vesicula TaxID=447962 RepID=A0AAD5U681_9FUNG|nr:hypothetical protein HK099_008418 [Clydaea vesicula]
MHEKFWKETIAAVESLLDISLPKLSNFANVASLVYWSLNDDNRNVNWAGFYFTKDFLLYAEKEKTLYLGPFQGRVACTVIPFGKGVCGKSAADKKSILVNDVHNFADHIACDSRSESEVVIPIVVDDTVIGVFDLDCLVKEGFSERDRAALEQIVNILVDKIL